MPTPRISKLKVENVLRFNKLELAFDPHFNLICGANGVGKTSILNIISSFFIRNHQINEIKRNAMSEGGSLYLTVTLDGKPIASHGEISAILPTDRLGPFGHALPEIASYLVYLRTSRDFGYRTLESIGRDQVTRDYDAQAKALAGLDPNNIKNWFANRWLFQAHSANWPAYQKSNLQTSIDLFSVLDPRVRLSFVDTATFEIIVETPSGRIPFEYLSSGFRAAYSVLLGIIMEIETRSVERDAKLFDGILLIDEMDLHLHPTWQKRFPTAIRNTFPNCQIIATTHSPHMVQVSGSHEVIALVEAEDGTPFRAPPPNLEYGYLGWTVEEILSDVMGLADTLTPEYRLAMKSFDDGIDAEDAEQVTRSLAVLEAMLHPTSGLRKLLRLQAASIGAEHDSN